MRNHTTLLAVTAAALLALTACSSSGDDASSESSTTVEAPSITPTPADAALVTQAVQAYTTAYFKGDGDTAYATLSKRCAGKVTAADYSTAIEQAAADYGPDHAATDVRAEVSGALARVTYKVAGLPKFDQQSQPWAREGGTWKYDAC